MRRPSIHLLTGAYVTDALDGEERRVFELHLDGCDDCLLEVEGLREAAGRLAELTAITPPPALRAAVLAATENLRPLPPLEVAEPPPVERRRRSVPSPGRRAATFALAAAVAVIAAVAGVTTPWQQGEEPTTSAASSILSAADAKHSTVESDAGWSAAVWHSDSLGQAVIVTENMPPPPRGLVYQLWLDQPSSGMVPAGLMPAAADQTVLLVGDAASADGAGITLEPVGGSEAPTSEPIARFDFGQGT